MKKLTEFIKKDIVLVISFVLAAASMLFAAPRENLLGYIDFRTLGLLFCLMAVMAGFNSIGMFRKAAEKLLSKARKSFHLYIIFTLLCFFSAMLITNDVALITFVPLTVITYNIAGLRKRLIYTVAMETLAANLGSMLTPIGNPQNLYLFSAFNIPVKSFVQAVFPYCALSLVLLLLGALFSGRDKLRAEIASENETPSKALTAMYFALFALCVLSVFRVLPYQALFITVLCALLVFDRKCVLKVDYSLLFTFVFLFIFIGNLGSIGFVRSTLANIVSGNEVPAAVAASQLLSNVPACILLSGFTNDTESLLIGVNLGGLGTLIASMASLISFKYIQKENVGTGRYILMFSVLNILFLAANLALWLVLC